MSWLRRALTSTTPGSAIERNARTIHSRNVVSVRKVDVEETGVVMVDAYVHDPVPVDSLWFLLGIVTVFGQDKTPGGIPPEEPDEG
ncbi:hypothetical protein [Corynebacterium frankenforstense]|uniref:hypothetical protein n=1 Tax=Corynebacterium frankenforstense TaxID=1230998 RepID=UPI0026ED201D|nr:hypothetical protein [Corynebacterium frankenforstense]